MAIKSARSKKDAPPTGRSFPAQSERRVPRPETFSSPVPHKRWKGSHLRFDQDVKGQCVRYGRPRMRFKVAENKKYQGLKTNDQRPYPTPVRPASVRTRWPLGSPSPQRSRLGGKHDPHSRLQRKHRVLQYAPYCDRQVGCSLAHRDREFR